MVSIKLKLLQWIIVTTFLRTSKMQDVQPFTCNPTSAERDKNLYGCDLQVQDRIELNK